MTITWQTHERGIVNLQQLREFYRKNVKLEDGRIEPRAGDVHIGVKGEAGAIGIGTIDALSGFAHVVRIPEKIIPALKAHNYEVTKRGIEVQIH